MMRVTGERTKTSHSTFASSVRAALEEDLKSDCDHWKIGVLGRESTHAHINFFRKWAPVATAPRVVHMKLVRASRGHSHGNLYRCGL